MIETGSITTGSLRVGVTLNLVVNGGFDDTISPRTRFWTGNNCALSWSGIGGSGQRLKIRSIQRGTEIGATGAIAAHHAHVQFIAQLPDRGVQLGQ
ncbi:hypothetical protein [Paracoccus sp. (in: a-proteobacteria)]|uniref:hypothetical protein n=1 Tax=Paracoccus sp. TaxID=267 RepID=UPI0032201658